MKKTEKILLLKNLNFKNNELDVKNEQLKDIVNFFMDEEPDIIKREIEDIKREEHDNNVNDTTDVSTERIEDQGNAKEEESNNNQIDEEINNINNELPQELKTIYRKIVVKTHPDKIKNSTNAEHYLDFYRKAVVAKDKNDIAEIIYIGFNLKIEEVFSLGDEYFYLIKNKIKELDNKSKMVEGNAFWLWFNTEDKTFKKSMVDHINKIRNGK
jgi:hypothetical protein